MSMSVGERDKKMSDMASVAAEAFCDKHTSPSVTDVHIKAHPEMYLEYTVPYLTVRTLHHLKADSRWIKNVCDNNWRFNGRLSGPDNRSSVLRLALGYGDPLAAIKRIANANTARRNIDTRQVSYMFCAWVLS